VNHLLIPAWHYTAAVIVERVWGWSPVEEAILLALLKKPGSSVDVARDLEIPVQVAKSAVTRLMQHGLLELRLIPSPALSVTKPGEAFVYKGMPLPERSEMRRVGISAVYEPFARNVLPRRDTGFQRYRKSEDGDVTLTIPHDGETANINSTFEVYARCFAEGRLRVGETVHSTDADTSRVAMGMMVFPFSDIRDGVFPPDATDELKRVLQDAIEGRAPRKKKVRSQSRNAAEGVRVETTFQPNQIVAGGAVHLDRFIAIVEAARSDVIVLSTWVALQDDQVGRPNKERLWQALERAVSRGVNCHLFHGAPPEEKKHAEAINELRVRLLKHADIPACANVHLKTRDTHAKFLAADDGCGGAAIVIGSCNWLQTPYYSFELSLELRDGAAAACGLSLFAETLAAQPGAMRTVDLLQRLAAHVGRLRSSTFASRAGKADAVGATLRVLRAHEHLHVLRTATREAEKRIICGTNRLGAPMEPALFDPLREAEGRVLDRRILYGVPSKPIRKRHVREAEALEGGVFAVPISNPTLHGKFFLWDDDDIVVTSMNLGSKQADPLKPLDEVGLHFHAPGAASILHQLLEEHLGGISRN
jgi:phosphatidylserine/phosphatidylglycerophosphate/cardiolipin synthase-like enzyme/predicted transcriptional regulator